MNTRQPIEGGIAKIETRMTDCLFGIPMHWHGRRTLVLFFLASFVLSAACRRTSTSQLQPIDRHNPEAVLRAYFDAWARNDTAREQSFMIANNAERFDEPVESVSVLSINLLDQKRATLWSSGSAETTRVYDVVFDYQPKGRGFSMERGRYSWTYILTWDAKHDSWLISNHGAG